MGRVIGIDLGSVNSVVSVQNFDGEVVVIPSSEGGRTTPSVVSYNKDGSVVVGQVAKRQAVVNPSNTIYLAKRFIGRKYKDVLSDVSTMPYKIVEGQNGEARFDVNGKIISPEEVSAHVLMKLKKAAEDYLGEPVTQAVITVPAYFDDSQRSRTALSGKIAGLEVLRIINEPTSAALAYGLDKKEEETILGLDLGGSTFDLSVLHVGGGVVEVLSTGGDTRLGGEEWDNCIVNWVTDQFKKENGIDLKKDPSAHQRLKEAAEKAKCELSSVTSTDINLPFITADVSGPKHLNYTLTRAKFEQLTDHLFNRVMSFIPGVLKDAGLDKTRIDEVLLIGGSTRIPKLQELVKAYFGKELNRSINPDESVSIGASIQGNILGGGSSTDILLLDVTPLSLGIETLGGVFTRLIDRNTTIPCKKSEIFSTAQDNQASVEIHVLQGEREFARDNKTLGKFTLPGIPPAPRGVPQVEVSFDIDANGIVHVSAKDLARGVIQNITISGGSGLSKEEIDRMVKDAEAHKSSDEEARKLVDLKNRAESTMYSTEKVLSENRDKISAQTVSNLESSISNLKTKLESKNVSELQAAFDEMVKASHKMSEEMYKSAGEAYSQQNTESQNSDPNEPVEATFEDVD